MLAMEILTLRRRWVRGLVLSGLLLAAVATSAVPMAHGESRSAAEYQLKAAFLYNFARFVEWPPEALAVSSTTMTICVLGTDPFGGILDTVLKGKTVKGRTMEIKRGREIGSPKFCHILFISSSEKRHLAKIQKMLNGSSVLVVGEMDRFVQRGGIINFIRVKNKIRFEINPDAAEHVGLKISSKLLRLANIIRN